LTQGVAIPHISAYLFCIETQPTTLEIIMTIKVGDTVRYTRSGVVVTYVVLRVNTKSVWHNWILDGKLINDDFRVSHTTWGKMQNRAEA
jgi:hypothetical protein